MEVIQARVSWPNYRREHGCPGTKPPTLVTPFQQRQLLLLRTAEALTDPLVDSVVISPHPIYKQRPFVAKETAQLFVQIHKVMASAVQLI